MSEARLTAQCKKYFTGIQKEHKDFYFQKLSDRFTSGLLDYYILFRGLSIWIELKDRGKKIDPIQNHTLKRLNRAGAITLWTDDFSAVKQLIGDIIKD